MKVDRLAVRVVAIYVGLGVIAVIAVTLYIAAARYIVDRYAGWMYAVIAVWVLGVFLWDWVKIHVIKRNQA